MQQFDQHNAEGQSVRRAETFRTSTNKSPEEFGLKSKSQANLCCETPDKNQDRTEDRVAKISKQENSTSFRKDVPSSRLSMMNEFDSD